MALLTLFLTHAPEKQEIPSVFTVRMFFFLAHFALLGHFCVVKTNSPSNSGQSKQAIGVKIPKSHCKFGERQQFHREQLACTNMHAWPKL